MGNFYVRTSASEHKVGCYIERIFVIFLYMSYDNLRVFKIFTHLFNVLNVAVYVNSKTI